MNDYYATIVHKERMAAFRRYADASRLAAEARRGRVTLRSTQVGLTALAATLAALALSGVLLVAAAAR